MNPVVYKKVSEPIRSVGQRMKPQRQKILEKIGMKTDVIKKKKMKKKKKKKKKSNTAESQ